MPHSQSISNNSILSRINLVPRIDTYFFNILFNIVLQSTPSPSKRFPSPFKTFVPSSPRVRRRFPIFNCFFFLKFSLSDFSLRYRVSAVCSLEVSAKFHNKILREQEFIVKNYTLYANKCRRNSF